MKTWLDDLVVDTDPDTTANDLFNFGTWWFRDEGCQQEDVDWTKDRRELRQRQGEPDDNGDKAEETEQERLEREARRIVLVNSRRRREWKLRHA